MYLSRIAIPVSAIIPDVLLLLHKWIIVMNKVIDEGYFAS